MRTLLWLPATLTLFATLGVSPAQGQIVWGASNTYGLGDDSGAELAPGALVEIGTFNLSDSQIQQAQFSLTTLKAGFVQFGAALIGDDVGIPGYWNKQTSGSTDALQLNGKKIYLWAFNAPTAEQATQQGVFTANNNGRWIFPSDGDIPSTTTIDLDDVNDIILGGFGNGTSSITHNPLFNLTTIPEPRMTNVACLAVCALIAAVVRISRSRSRRSRQATDSPLRNGFPAQPIPLV